MQLTSRAKEGALEAAPEAEGGRRAEVEAAEAEAAKAEASGVRAAGVEATGVSAPEA